MSYPEGEIWCLFPVERTSCRRVESGKEVTVQMTLVGKEDKPDNEMDLAWPLPWRPENRLYYSI